MQNKKKEVDEEMEFKIGGSASSDEEAEEIEEIAKIFIIKMRITDICNPNNESTKTNIYNFDSKPKLSHF